MSRSLPSRLPRHAGRLRLSEQYRTRRPPRFRRPARASAAILWTWRPASRYPTPENISKAVGDIRAAASDGIVPDRPAARTVRDAFGRGPTDTPAEKGTG